MEDTVTPNRWKVGKALTAATSGRFRVYRTESNETIAHVFSDQDAALIAAAPEMYAALINAFVAMGHAGANADTKHPLRAAWEDARAAIARAEGRQP